MLKRIGIEDGNLIEEYIGTEYERCLYIYLDYIKYGLNNDNLKFWAGIEDNKITCIILRYYSGLHIFSKDKNCNYDEIKKLILDENPSVICAEKYLIENLSEILKDKDYSVEYGWIRVLSEKYPCENSSVERATEEDFEEISNFIINDRMGEFYGLDELVAQIKEREDDGYGRNYVIKDNGNIVSNASTTAESDKVAVLSNVITVPSHRGKGLATVVCSKLCNDLIDEGKNVYLINYTEESTGLYNKLGFEIHCEIGKLY